MRIPTKFLLSPELRWFTWLSLKTWAQFENLGELVKNTIFVA